MAKEKKDIDKLLERYTPKHTKQEIFEMMKHKEKSSASYTESSSTQRFDKMIMRMSSLVSQ